MLDDRLHQMFEQIAVMPVHAPPAERVLARGQQRRRRARLQASAVAGVIMVAAGVGAPQLPVSLTVGARQARPVHLKIAAPNPYPSFGWYSTPAPAGPSPAQALGTTQPQGASVTSGESTAATQLLPPPGGGQLILGLDSADHYVMTRAGSAVAPIRVPGLSAARGSPAVLATNPAGGWVVTLASKGAAPRAAPARLALVTTTGQSVRFGPEFNKVTVTSAAVSQDGTRVAVALAGSSGPAKIEVMPLPGHRGSLRTWSVPATRAEVVTGLSWVPDGRRLVYLPGQRAVAGSTGGPGILDTARQGPAMPAMTTWVPPLTAGPSCTPAAVAWLGRGGRYAVLESCASTGTALLETTAATVGSPADRQLVVAHRVGCQASLDPSGSGASILISYCGLYLDVNGRLTKAPAGLTAAALGG